VRQKISNNLQSNGNICAQLLAIVHKILSLLSLTTTSQEKPVRLVGLEYYNTPEVPFLLSSKVRPHLNVKITNKPEFIHGPRYVF
jgi:hypothetical protein